MDELLILYLKVNKKKAFDLIYRTYKDKVTGLCYKILKDKTEVEDTVQEIFLKVFSNIDKFKFKSKISTWIYRISINYILNVNKKVTYNLEFDEVYMKEHFGIDIELKELEEKISDALKKLNGQEKKVFILREMQGLSYKEIAQILKMKEGTVKSKLHYIKLKLRKTLKGYLGS